MTSHHCGQPHCIRPCAKHVVVIDEAGNQVNAHVCAYHHEMLLSAAKNMKIPVVDKAVIPRG